MPDIKISEVARLTGLSMRYWQRRALRGDMPGAHYFETGNRRIYFVDRDRFTSWWSKQADTERAAVTIREYASIAYRHKLRIIPP